MDSRGYVHQLADDMERAMKFYQLRASNHEMKQCIARVLKYLESWGNNSFEEHEPERQAYTDLKNTLERAEG